MNEARGESSFMSYSSSKQGLEMALNEQSPPDRAYDVAFSSMPTTHLNEQAGSGFDDTAVDGKTFSQSCPEPIPYVGSPKICMDGFLPSHQVDGFARKKLFTPYWLVEAVNGALEVSSKWHLESFIPCDCY